MKTTTKLRQLIREPGIIVAPGAYDCLTARLIERAGFPAVYMTGAGTALTRLGKPDLGFATLSEMVANAAAMASTVSIPLIADADTGYGGRSMSTVRSGSTRKLALQRCTSKTKSFPSAVGIWTANRWYPSRRWSSSSALPWTHVPMRTLC
jgi:ketopantoate hydroxymethyltransferase